MEAVTDTWLGRVGGTRRTSSLVSAQAHLQMPSPLLCSALTALFRDGSSL